jgi:hypothetical protein
MQNSGQAAGASSEGAKFALVHNMWQYAMLRSFKYRLKLWSNPKATNQGKHEKVRPMSTLYLPLQHITNIIGWFCTIIHLLYHWDDAPMSPVSIYIQGQTSLRRIRLLDIFRLMGMWIFAPTASNMCIKDCVAYCPSPIASLEQACIGYCSFPLL